jgi:hypothetical protein
MLLAPFIRPSPQFDALLELPNQELLEPDGSHEDELELIDGSQPDDDPDGNQLDDEEDQLDDGDENRVDPRTTPTPKPMPKTASTVEIG